MKFAVTLIATLLAASAASAQLSSPVPQGSGPGVHSPNSPFAPLPQRGDVVPWSKLSAVKTRTEKNKVLPDFQPELRALNQTPQRIQGFMLPLEPGEKASHFLLSSVPLTCGFCTPGGPESMVEVKAKTPVRYTLDPVVVEGNFATLDNDPHGLYYRVTDAVPVK
jgi:hypothetical protein